LGILLYYSACAQAESVVYFRTDNTDVIAGQTISVEIFTTALTDHVTLDKISDDAGGQASNLWLNPNYNSPLDAGTAVNLNHILIEGVSSGIAPAFPAVSDVLYKFDYLVPQLASGTEITIFADPSDGSVNEVWCDLNLGLEAITPDSLVVTIVPEPVTILFLGTGVLTLITRNRKKY
jgi:hypothetical protein